MVENTNSRDWRTKPTDRFILRWIKLHLAAHLSPRLAGMRRLRPWMVTVASTGLGTAAGIIFACGWGWPAGLIAMVGQVLDGVDGQLARLTGRESAAGAYLDSVLDRYADGAMMIGMMLYLVRLPLAMPPWILLTLGGLAIVGGNSISYSTARADSLKIDTGRPTLASKGTRMSVMIVCALGSYFWPPLPVVALIYIAAHTNIAVARRLLRAYRKPPKT